MKIKENRTTLNDTRFSPQSSEARKSSRAEVCRRDPRKRYSLGLRTPNQFRSFSSVNLLVELSHHFPLLSKSRPSDHVRMPPPVEKEVHPPHRSQSLSHL